MEKKEKMKNLLYWLDEVNRLCKELTQVWNDKEDANKKSKELKEANDKFRNALHEVQKLRNKT